jgi:3-oxoacyl-[acyl-carrier protein] reductase
VADRLGPVEVLVLNATGSQPEADLTDVAWEDHLAQFDFFVKSPVLLARAVVPECRRGGLVALCISTPRSRIARHPGRSAYVTGKSAQIGLTRSWARDLAPCGITVNTVAPGFIRVECHADVPTDVRDTYLASVAAVRMGRPENIAHSVSFLASDQAAFITGQRIVVDGDRDLGS